MNKQASTAFKDYLSLVKFSHTIFALPFALIGYFLALHLTGNAFTVKVFLLVILCMVLARNAAMSFNRVTDRFIDKRNPRTANREIPSGKIHPRHAFIFAMVNAILFIVTTLFINKLVFFLSPIAILIVLGYSYTKQYTVLCHFVLGLGLSLAPIGAFLAAAGQWHVVPLMLSILVFTWVAGFDILYATLDEDFDKEESLRSIPAVFGSKRAKVISAFLHLIVVFLVIRVGVMLNTGNLYSIGAIIFIALLITQHLVVALSKSQRGVNFAFAYLNGIASLLFAIFTISSFYY